MTHKSIFESPKNITRQQGLQVSEKYHLAILAAGQYWKSDGFVMPKSVTIVVPTAKVTITTYPPSVQITRSNSDKEASQN
jgi:hypothetical protein